MIISASYFRHITERTNGTFAVASDAAHLSDLLQAHTVPPPELQHKGNLNSKILYRLDKFFLCFIYDVFTSFSKIKIEIIVLNR